jgi:hypothetical protein
MAWVINRLTQLFAIGGKALLCFHRWPLSESDSDRCDDRRRAVVFRFAVETIILLLDWLLTPYEPLVTSEGRTFSPAY